jgi:cellobiose dehydrogenase (acceptor)
MRSSLLALGFAAGALAQSAASYVDDNTGITFMGFEDTSGFKYGMVLPETVGGDFIGQIVRPLPLISKGL